MRLILQNSDRKELLSKSVKLYKKALSELEKFSPSNIEDKTLNILRKAGFDKRDAYLFNKLLSDATVGYGSSKHLIKDMISEAEKELTEELKKK